MARHLRQLIQEKDGKLVETGTKKRDNGPPVWFLVSKEGVGAGGSWGRREGGEEEDSGVSEPGHGEGEEGAPDRYAV